MSQRDPFPFPRFENDHSFAGFMRQEREPFDKPPHIAQNEEPWSRLYDKATLASIRRSVMYYDDQESTKDSLDFHLKSTYDHHKEFLQSRSQTLYQKETISQDHGRILKNREEQQVPQNDLEKDIKMWVSFPKCSIYSIQGSIESHHNASTNRGYSRKHDGGFYST